MEERSGIECVCEGYNEALRNYSEWKRKLHARNVLLGNDERVRNE